MNINLLKFAMGLFVVSTLFGCATKSSVPMQPADVSVPTGVDEQLIWSSAPQRPGWTMEEPDTINGRMSFVGLSGSMATEKAAREDARRNAVNGVVAYMGTLAKDKFERARVSFGLESTVVDPTSSSRAFEKQLAVNIANRVKPKKWYAEKWQTLTGIGYRVFVLAHVPMDSMDESYKSMARDMAKNAENNAKQAADNIAKAQAEKAADFWKQMQSQGLVE